MRSILILLTVGLYCAWANAQTLKILTAGAFEQVAAEFIPSFEKENGIKIDLQNATPFAD